MPWLAVGAVGAISGIANFFANQSANDRAAMLQDQSFKQWMNLHVPDPAEQKVALQQFVSAGTFVPKLQAALKQDPSAMEKIVTDSTQKGAQNNALSQLEDIGNQGGLRLQDKAALQDAQLKSEQQAKGNRDAISSEMARRGLGGSGFDVAAKLEGQQGQADRDAQSSLGVAAHAQDRALQAIEGAGSMAGQQRAQDFGEQSAKANAADAINRFNTQNAQRVNDANVGTQNAAQAYNLQNNQRISDQNAQLSNSEQMYNKSLAQKQYEDQLQQVAGATGQSNNLAKTAQQGGQLEGNTFSNIGTGLTGAYTAGQNYDLLNNYLKNKNSGGSGRGSGSQDEDDGGW